jgi:hypothetical protein
MDDVVGCAVGGREEIRGSVGESWKGRELLLAGKSNSRDAKKEQELVAVDGAPPSPSFLPS